MHELIEAIELLCDKLEVVDDLVAFLGKVKVIGEGRTMRDGGDRCCKAQVYSTHVHNVIHDAVYYECMSMHVQCIYMYAVCINGN